jgi:vitamin B12 transporter
MWQQLRLLVYMGKDYIVFSFNLGENFMQNFMGKFFSLLTNLKTIAIFAILPLSLLLLPVFQGVVIAQETDSDSSQLLDAIVVTAGRTSESYRTVSQPITVIDEEEIQQKNAADLPDLLRQQGFQYNPLGAQSGLVRVAIRGFATSTSPNDTGDVIILLDGRQIGNNNIGMVAIQNVERVEVLHGPGAMQYGSNATGGVINLITKRGKEKPTAFVEQTIGSFDTNRSNVGFSGKLSIVDFSFGFGYMNAGNYSVGKGVLHGKRSAAASAQNVVGDRVYENTRVNDRYNMLGNVGININENHRIGIVQSMFYSVQGRSGDLQDTKVAYPYGKAYRKNYSTDIIYNGQAPSVDLSWMLRYFNGKTRYMTSSNWLGGATLYDYGTEFNGIQAQANWDYKTLHLTGGVERYEEKYYQVNTPPYNSKFTDLAFYLIGRVGLINEKLWISAGVRHDSFVSESVLEPQKEKAVTTSFGIAFLPVDFIKFRVNYGESFRMPTPDKLTGDSVSAGGIRYIGNPNLKKESSQTYDIGFDLSYESFNAGFTYFITDYKDRIETVRISTAPRVDTWENLIGISKYRGIEFNFDWEMGQTFDWNFELKPYLTLTKMSKMNAPDGTELETVADLSMAYGVSFRYPDVGLAASLDVNYYGRQQPNTGSTLWGGVEFGGDTVMDFHLTKDLMNFENGGKVKIKVDILNLGNKLYQLSAGYPQPGRAFNVTLRYEY